jgi:hypothetical protein
MTNSEYDQLRSRGAAREGAGLRVPNIFHIPMHTVMVAIGGWEIFHTDIPPVQPLIFHQCNLSLVLWKWVLQKIRSPQPPPSSILHIPYSNYGYGIALNLFFLTLGAVTSVPCPAESGPASGQTRSTPQPADIRALGTRMITKPFDQWSNAVNTINIWPKGQKEPDRCRMRRLPCPV